MIKYIQPAMPLLQALSFAALMLSVLFLTKTGNCEELTEMEKKKAFWKAVDQIENTRPYTKASVESALGVEIELKSENSYTLFYKLTQSKGVPNSIGLTAVDLRISKNKPDDQGLLALDLASPEIDIDEVRSRYPNADFRPALPGPPPQGVSPNSFNYVNVKSSWGELDQR